MFIEWLLDHLCSNVVGCWPVKNSHIQKLRVAEMRMSGLMCGYTMRDRIPNKVGVTSMMDKMREVKLGWFEHVKRR